MFHLRTALKALGAMAWFAVGRLRVGVLALAAIIVVKILGAVWLPQAGAAPPTASWSGPSVSATAAIPAP
jgi:hypothetical protein